MDRQIVRKKAILIDVDYKVGQEGTKVRLLLKGKRFFRLYDDYTPYFYVEGDEEVEEEIKKIKIESNGRTIFPIKIERVKRNAFGKERDFLKVYCERPSDVPHLSNLIKYPVYEANIPFGKRYMIDKGIAPFTLLVYERSGKNLLRIIKKKQGNPKFNAISFDIETYNPTGMPRPDKDEVIMISYELINSGERKVITSKEINRDFVISCKDEREMIVKFLETIRKNDIELIFGYNSTEFDLPYLKARADVNGLDFKIGRDGTSFRTKRQGLRNVVEITGRIHIDLYPIIRFMGFIGAFKISKYTLENAYEEITGKKKKMVKKLEIWKMWEDEKLREELAEYSLFDAFATAEIGKILLPLQIEMSRLTYLPLFDVVNATAGQLVESLLMYKSVQRNMIIPNKPDDKTIKDRELGPIKGAFVKIPQPGIYENLVVFDFRGLYPSIITSHNIDPYTVNPPKEIPDSECFVAPNGTRFLKEPKGIIPSVLEELIKMRAEMKNKLKTLDKNSKEYEILFAKVQSLKILSNSYYGYLAYPRSRWYSRDCGEAVTAFGRYYIQKTIEEAEKAGFEVLYGDTDSVFLLLGNKSKQDALEFMKKINEQLPGDMELELEGFYPRGLFVTKKVKKEETGAKKKYALIAEDGSIKIRGFELVRRDWSAIAKTTQKKVLEAILKHGSKELAVKEVKSVIEKLKAGKVQLEDLVIYTQLRKDPKKYDVTSPELAAVQKALAKNIHVEKGSVIGYIITRKGKTISEKAQLAELAEDYDPNYYIDNQILPAVLKILKELGYNEDELKGLGKQSEITSFFE